jgi:hypothetical protein
MIVTRFPEAPPQIQRLPLDERGFPVPWFTPWIKGKPDFRAVYPDQSQKAHTKGLCWICGGRNIGVKAFVIGPMCAVNRVSAEPPSHLSCARFAAVACPFLSRPLAKRADVSDLNGQPPPGIMIERNPGVTLIWSTQTYRAEKHDTGLLFRIGAPIKTEWFAYGRAATRAEVVESIETGLPRLVEVAKQDGPLAMAELRKCLERAVKLVPAE